MNPSMLLDFIDMNAINRIYGAHSVLTGEKNLPGIGTVPSITLVVPEKLAQTDVVRSGKSIIPQTIVINGEQIVTDVIAATYTPQILRTDDEKMMALAAALADQGKLGPWQSCWDSPVPGGVQIAPVSAPWVGTLGAAVQYRKLNAGGDWSYGFITNWHVASSGKYGPGTAILQPFGNSKPIERAMIGELVAAPHPDSTNGSADVALCSAKPKNGFWPGDVVTCAPRQLVYDRTFRPINPSPIPIGEVRIPGHRVWKSGRTTAATAGVVTGMGNFTVSYDRGAVMFRKMLVIQQGSGSDFSQPGDSGSLIMDQESHRPVALLFAGGGGQTIAMPIANAIDALASTGYEVRFFGMPS